MKPPKRHSNLQTMTQITMPREFDGAIQSVIAQARDVAVQALSEKYGFDQDEAQRFLADGGIKVVKMRGPVPKPKATKAAKATKATKAADGESKTKRATTGYLMFSAEQRPEVKEEMTGALAEGSKLAPQAVVKELAARWKALEEEERLEWNQLAAVVPSVETVFPGICNHVEQCSCGA